MGDAYIVDIGGTYIRFGVTGLSADKPMYTFETPKSKEEILELLSTILNDAIGLHPIKDRRVIISSPGLISTKGTVDKVIYLSLTGVNLKSFVEDNFGMDCIVENDANLQALGANQKQTNLLFLTIGTAVGGAYVNKGNAFLGHRGYACEFGHIYVGTQKQCYCGNRGCLDTIVSGKVMIDLFGDGWWTRTDDELLRYLKYAGEVTGRAMADLSILYDPSDVLICGRICIKDEFVKGAIKSFTSNAWNLLTLRFETDSWKNVYNGACSIAKY